MCRFRIVSALCPVDTRSLSRRQWPAGPIVSTWGSRQHLRIGTPCEAGGWLSTPTPRKTDSSQMSEAATKLQESYDRATGNLISPPYWRCDITVQRGSNTIVPRNRPGCPWCKPSGFLSFHPGELPGDLGYVSYLASAPTILTVSPNVL